MYIGLLKEEVHKYMHVSHSPMVRWDYKIERRYLIHNNNPHPMFQNNGHTTHEVNLGEPEEISNLCVYGWHEWT